MKRLALILVSIFSLLVSSGQAISPAAPTFQAPVLKWQLGGCYTSWCETGWYSSAAVADLDNNGTQEVIAGSYSVVILNGADGSLERRIDPEGGRVWPGVVVADLENDGDLEIVTAHNDGYLHVFNHNGDAVWSKQPTQTSNELRSLAAYDLEKDGDLEIIVASTRNYNQWYVYEHTSALRSGNWPQHNPDSDTNGYTAGCFNENVAVGDLDGDGKGEIVGSNDTHYMAAFQDDGAQMRASTIYGLNPDSSPKVWSRVGVHVDHSVDLRGYANCGVEHRPNFDESAPLIVDVNNDGVNETIVVGSNYNCDTSPYTDLYEMPYIFNADRTRWKGNGYDWTTIPIPDAYAAPVSQNYDIIQNNAPNPVAVDLDGNGFLEIIYPSYDGRMHAYWLDKTEHGSWPYSVYKPAEGFYRFASEPAVADLDNNGQAEVIFASWTQIGKNQTGKLHILNTQGTPLYEVNLPPGFGGANWNGALAAPTLANIDSDADLEAVLNTAHSGVVAYDLPGTANARILWGTGRGNYQRSGSTLIGKLDHSTKFANLPWANPGDAMSYQIVLRATGADISTAVLTDTVPMGVSYAGELFASSGTPSFSSGAVHWTGSVPIAAPVTITFNVTIISELSTPSSIRNQAVISGAGGSWNKQALTIIGGVHLYLPVIQR